MAFSGPFQGSAPLPFACPWAVCGPSGVLFGGQLGGHFQKSRETLDLQGGRSERVGFEPTVRINRTTAFEF